MTPLLCGSVFHVSSRLFTGLGHPLGELIWRIGLSLGFPNRCIVLESRSSVEARYSTALDTEEALFGTVYSDVHVFVAGVVKSLDTLDGRCRTACKVVWYYRLGFDMCILSVVDAQKPLSALRHTAPFGGSVAPVRPSSSRRGRRVGGVRAGGNTFSPFFFCRFSFHDKFFSLIAAQWPAAPTIQPPANPTQSKATSHQLKAIQGNLTLTQKHPAATKTNQKPSQRARFRWKGLPQANAFVLCSVVSAALQLVRKSMRLVEVSFRRHGTMFAATKSRSAAQVP